MERNPLISNIVYDLVEAEERYLVAMGWRKISESDTGTHSLWKNPEFTIKYSRNHAVLIAKSKDQNIGIW